MMQTNQTNRCYKKLVYRTLDTPDINSQIDGTGAYYRKYPESEASISETG